MLSKLAELKDPQQQQQYLIKLIELSIKNSRQFINELNQQLIKKLQSVATKQNFSLWYQLILTLLSIQECFQYADASTKPQSPLLNLLDYIGQFKVEDKHEVVHKIIPKYPSIQLSVGIHGFIVRHCIQGVQQKQYPRLIPIFIRLTSFIIQKYLQLKNQPAKGDQDRIQDDKVILKCCQKWVSTNIGLFFKRLSPVQDKTIKQLVLLAVGDVIGALLQIERSDVLDKQMINNLLQKYLLNFCKANYSWNQVHHIFNSHLRIKRYENPIKKIQIPEIYSDYSIRNVGLNTQAYSYIITKYIKSGVTLTNCPQSLLKLLIPAVSQMLPRPYQIKVQSIYLLEKTLQNMTTKQKIKIRTGIEYGYPIQLLLFNFTHYEKQRAQKITQHFQFQNENILAYSLIKLQQIHIDNLSKQKNKYILKTILDLKLSSEKLFVILNKFRFSQQKPKTQLIALQVAQNLRQKYANKVIQLVKKWRKQGGENLESGVKQKLASFTL